MLAELAASHRVRVERFTGSTISAAHRYAALGMIEANHREVLQKSAGEAFAAAQETKGALEDAATTIIALFRGEGKFVGFVAHRCTEEESLQVCYLLELQLSRPMRRRGLGRALMAEVEASGRRAGASGLMLTCDLRNEVALQFYRTAGFVTSPCSPSACLRPPAHQRAGQPGHGYELLVMLWAQGALETLHARAAEARSELLGAPATEAETARGVSPASSSSSSSSATVTASLAASASRATTAGTEIAVGWSADAASRVKRGASPTPLEHDSGDSMKEPRLL